VKLKKSKNEFNETIASCRINNGWMTEEKIERISEERIQV